MKLRGRELNTQKEWSLCERLEGRRWSRKEEGGEGERIKE